MRRPALPRAAVCALADAADDARREARFPGFAAALGHPIREPCGTRDWGIDAHQTVVGGHAGSAGMPSAGRALTPEVVTELTSLGIGFSPVVLHAGVSSADAGEPPSTEWFRVPVE